MHTTVHDGVKDDHVDEFKDVFHKLSVAFSVTHDELEHALHRVGLYLMCGSPERPYDIGVRRLPPSLQQRKITNGR